QQAAGPALDGAAAPDAADDAPSALADAATDAADDGVEDALPAVFRVDVRGGGGLAEFAKKRIEEARIVDDALLARHESFNLDVAIGKELDLPPLPRDGNKNHDGFTSVVLEGVVQSMVLKPAEEREQVVHVLPPVGYGVMHRTPLAPRNPIA